MRSKIGAVVAALVAGCLPEDGGDVVARGLQQQAWELSTGGEGSGTSADDDGGSTSEPGGSSWDAESSDAGASTTRSFGEGRYQYICRCFTVCWNSPQRVYFEDEYLGVYDAANLQLPCDGSDDGRSMQAEMMCLQAAGGWPETGNIAEPVTCTLLLDDLGIGD